MKNPSIPYGSSWSPLRIRRLGVIHHESRPIGTRTAGFGFSHSNCAASRPESSCKSVNSSATWSTTSTSIACRGR